MIELASIADAVDVCAHNASAWAVIYRYCKRSPVSICFGRSLHCAVLLLTSFDCLSFMNMCPDSLHGGGCQLSSLRESALAWLRFKKDAVLQDLVQASVFIGRSCLGLSEDDRTEVLLMSSCCHFERNMLSNDSDLRKMLCFMQLSSPILFREVTAM